MMEELHFFPLLPGLPLYGKSQVVGLIRMADTSRLFTTHHSPLTTHSFHLTTHSAKGLSCTIYLTYDQAGVKIIPLTRVRVRTASGGSFSPIARGRIRETGS